MAEIKWHDSRLKAPSSHRYDQYTVVYKLSEEGITMLGRAEWIPKDGYTSGDWGDCTCTNGNKHGKCEVLYWIEHPKSPELS